ncbi:Protein FAR-RED ELONGATED HYPOCOTYL 3 [Cardamine amara subsp. amara]|uniref:Protein FAR-RED ELONGATED HYPOCOTYL 3 n=1 Tax=Cardamine amara subsp. amara TaxID=228776 RepID=A0ABD1A607_CARAN
MEYCRQYHIYTMWLCENKEQVVLHVEVVEGVEQTRKSSQASRQEITSGKSSRVMGICDEVRNDAGENVDRVGCFPEIGESSESFAGWDIVPCNPYIGNNELSVNDCEGTQGDLDVDEYRGTIAYPGVDNYQGSPVVEPDEVVDVVEVEWDDGIDMRVKQEFDSKCEVQDLVDRAVHKHCFEVATIKSTRKLLVYKCRSIGCKWSVRVATEKGSDRWSVRTYNKMHKCSRLTTSTSNIKKKGTPLLVASVVHEDYPDEYETPIPKMLIGLVQRRLSCEVSYSTTLRGKKLAVADLRGSPEDCYKMLPSYLHMLEKMNHGTLTRLECGEGNKFKYVFFALGASIEGFQVMRKVIIVDGTFLKTVYGGVLIVATAQDPEHHNYPLAFAVVDSENNASWRWFLQTLKTVVPDHPELVFVSHKNKSIIKTVGEVYPNTKHGYCLWHMSQNMKSRAYGVNKKEVAAQFRECGRIYTEVEFLRVYHEFRIRHPECDEYLDESVNDCKWARCYFPGERYNICTTNFVESINGVFKDQRKYSLLPLFDSIIAKICEWSNKHRKATAEVPPTQKLVPYVYKLLHTRCEIAKKLPVTELNSFMLEYTVIGEDGKRHMVDLRSKSCSCRRYDINKYPCKHAIAATMFHVKTSEVDLHECCSRYNFSENWVTAYCKTIYPVPNTSALEVPTHISGRCVLPPDYAKKKRKNSRG